MVLNLICLNQLKRSGLNKEFADRFFVGEPLDEYILT